MVHQEAAHQARPRCSRRSPAKPRTPPPVTEPSARLKEGLASGAGEKERLAGLARFRTTFDGDGDAPTSLDAYVARMKEGQDAIYFATADNVGRMKDAPQLEALRARGWEVLLGVDTVDEWALEAIGEHGGKKLVSALRADVALPDADEGAKTSDAEREALGPLLAVAKRVLDGRASDVVASSRLTGSPACPCSGAPRCRAPRAPHAPERPRGAEGQACPRAQPDAPAREGARRRAAADADDPALARYVGVLFDQAALAEGSELADPVGFAREVGELLTQVLGRP